MEAEPSGRLGGSARDAVRQWAGALGAGLLVVAAMVLLGSLESSQPAQAQEQHAQYVVVTVVTGPGQITRTFTRHVDVYYGTVSASGQQSQDGFQLTDHINDGLVAGILADGSVDARVKTNLSRDLPISPWINPTQTNVEWVVETPIPAEHLPAQQNLLSAYAAYQQQVGGSTLNAGNPILQGTRRYLLDSFVSNETDPVLGNVAVTNDFVADVSYFEQNATVVLGAGASATPTRTVTPTRTPTAIATPTRTPTATVTPTRTLTPTGATATAMPTATRTSTVTPTRTGTPTGGPAGTLVVTTTNDTGPGSLRQAILDANATPGPNTISFTILTANAGSVGGAGLPVGGCDPTTLVCTIAPLSALPVLTGPVTIDGFTQPGAHPNSNPLDQPINAVLRIELSGLHAGPGDIDGLVLTGGSSTVRGLAITGFSGSGIVLRTNGGNVIAGMYIGTDAATGTEARGNGYFVGVVNDGGVVVDNVPGTTIGGFAPADRNLIAAQSVSGVVITGAGATGAAVRGNFIGADASGSAPLGNLTSGISIGGGASGNTVGGSASGAGNLISANGRGISLGSGANGNRITGNRIGTDRTGLLALGNGDGISVFIASNNTIGGTAVGAGNLVAGNLQHGVAIEGLSQSPTSSGNLALGNLIGTTATGMQPLGNGEAGVLLVGNVSANVIGGSVTGAGNVIAANGDDGVTLRGEQATGNIIHGNWIGTDVSGTIPLGNAGHGVRSEGTGGVNTIGLALAGTGVGNTIAHNGGDGVAIVAGAVTANHAAALVPTGRVAVLGNSIYGNSGLGIDLDDDGVTPNDVGDGDIGANERQNFPVLTTATGGASTTVQGTLSSKPSSTYRLEFFASPACDPMGYGEGRVYLGTASVTTNASGLANFSAPGLLAMPGGSAITATAADALGNTSEFSACSIAGGATPTVTSTAVLSPSATRTPTGTATAGPSPTRTPTVTAAVVVNSTDDGDDGQCNPAHCSLREAINAANARVGTDSIVFAIPATDPGCSAARGTCRIRPRTRLPVITGPVVLDATTQSVLAAGAQARSVGARATTAAPRVELDGNDAGVGATGLELGGGSGTLRGLAVFGFDGDGLHLTGTGGHRVLGSYVGLDASGAVDRGNRGNGIFVTSPNNAIGGTAAGEGNVITGNGQAGVDVQGATADGTVILGNLIGTDPTGTRGLGNAVAGVYLRSSNNVIGGTSAAARNVISANGIWGIFVFTEGATGPGPENNRIQGNYIGTDVSGSRALGNSAGIQLSVAFFTVIGGTAPDAGNLISGNQAFGIQSRVTVDLRIEGNLIGTDASGTVAIPNEGDGLQFTDTYSSTVGGTVAGAGNVISGNGGYGVRFLTSTPWADGLDNQIVQGNFIGTDGSGINPLGNANGGILVTDRKRVTIGNLAGGTGGANRIAYNGGDGIAITGAAAQVAVRGNQIWRNGGLGIDLGSNGVTANDASDGDPGPNQLQNYPVLTTVTSNGAGTTVQGTLASAASTTYRIELFYGESCDPSGNGEGQTLLGGLDVTTNGSGNGAFTQLFAGTTVPGNYVVTGTATDPQGNTSEFSACRTAAGPTVTPTSTATATASATATLTTTPPATSSPTVTRTSTPTPSRTATLTAAATSTPTPSVTPSRTPTVTPTAAMGGRGLTLQVGTTSGASRGSVGGAATTVQLGWRTGVTQTGYIVLRWDAITNEFAFLPSFDAPLGGPATSYPDLGPLPDATYCYVLLILGGNPASINNVLGLSDLLCVNPNTGSGSNVPGGFNVRLNDGNVATLGWSPVAGASSYRITATRFDGSPQQVLTPTPAGATTFSEDTTGLATCYQVQAIIGGIAQGTTDTICGAPGISSLGSGATDLSGARDRLRRATVAR